MDLKINCKWFLILTVILKKQQDYCDIFSKTLCLSLNKNITFLEPSNLIPVIPVTVQRCDIYF